jgi:hypothetical protein
VQSVAGGGNCLLRRLGTLLEDGGQYSLLKEKLYSLCAVTGKYFVNFVYLTSFEMIRASLQIQRKITKCSCEKWNV